MRPNQVQTVLSAVAYSLVPHDDSCAPHYIVLSRRDSSPAEHYYTAD